MTSQSPTPLPPTLPSDDPEQAYTRSTAAAHRRSYSQFFTPIPIARWMVDWVLGGAGCSTLLDPAVGLGVFLRLSLHRETPPPRLIGYDLDPHILERCRELLSGSTAAVELYNRDYLLNDWDRQYDGIICNPPYQHFQSYAHRPEILDEFQTRLHLPLSGLTNLHSLFLLKSIVQLADHGRAAYLIPSECLNADYGEAIKAALVRDGLLKTIVVFDHTSHIFQGAITTACILLLEKNQKPGPVAFYRVPNFEALDHLEIARTGAFATLACSQLDPKVKWRTYYQPSAQAQEARQVPLTTYGRVSRGMATGDNSFFCFDLEKAAAFGLSEADLVPCLTKAAQASASFFTLQDFAALQQRGKNVFVLNAHAPLTEPLRQYLQRGEALGVPQKFLTRHRNPWYRLEAVPPAPILVTVFNRHRLRLIRNEAGVRHLTCFHGLYLTHPEETLDLLMAYLLTDAAQEALVENRREYGDGLVKFEPNDLNRALVVDLRAIPDRARSQIQDLYRDYRQSVIVQDPDETTRARLNQAFFPFTG